MTTDSAQQASAIPKAPLGERRGQRIATYVLLGVSVLGLLAALLLPPFPLYRGLAGAQAVSVTFAVVPGKAGMLVFSAYSQVILFVASAVVSYLLLSRRKVAFYIPLAAGALAAIVFWIVFALLLL